MILRVRVYGGGNSIAQSGSDSAVGKQVSNARTHMPLRYYLATDIPCAHPSTGSSV